MTATPAADPAPFGYACVDVEGRACSWTTQLGDAERNAKFWNWRVVPLYATPPDPLRERVEALANTFAELAESRTGGAALAFNTAAEALRALLTDQPEPEPSALSSKASEASPSQEKS